MTGIFKIFAREPVDSWISSAMRNVTKQTTLALARAALGAGAAGDVVFLATTNAAIRTAIGAVHDGMLNAGQLSGFRNRVINGDMAIDQRNAGAAVTLSSATFGYPVDRFAAYLGSALVGTVTAQRVATALATEARYATRIARSAGAYASVVFLAQAIETANVADLAGKKVILSFKARKGSAFAAGFTASILTGNGTDQSLANMVASAWTGQVTAGSVTPTLTTSFQTFSVSATLGASVSQIGFYLATGAFTGSGGANDYFDITDVQIEVCDATLPQSTPFERRPLNLEQVLCERYYERVGGGDSLQMFAMAQAISTTQCRGPVPFRVKKRSTPTVTAVGTVSNWAADAAGGTQIALTVATPTRISTDAFEFVATVASGLVAGNASAIRANSSTAVYWTADAEL